MSHVVKLTGNVGIRMVLVGVSGIFAIVFCLFSILEYGDVSSKSRLPDGQMQIIAPVFRQAMDGKGLAETIRSRIAGPSDQNAFPLLFELLLGSRPVDSDGNYDYSYEALNGRVFVQSSAAAQGSSLKFRRAAVEDLKRKEIPKYVLDPFGQPYVFRTDWPKQGCAVLYSIWSNGRDDGANGETVNEDLDDFVVWSNCIPVSPLGDLWKNFKVSRVLSVCCVIACVIAATVRPARRANSHHGRGSPTSSES